MTRATDGVSDKSHMNPPTNLLVLLDLSTSTAAVLRAAKVWAGRLSAKVWLLHVAAPDPDFVGYELDTPTMRDVVAKRFHDEHRQLEAAARELRTAGLDTTSLLVQGPTVEAILKEAAKLQADAIIAGSHGHGAIHDLLVGSTIREVIRHSTRPILLIPPNRETPTSGSV